MPLTGTGRGHIQEKTMADAYRYSHAFADSEVKLLIQVRFGRRGPGHNFIVLNAFLRALRCLHTRCILSVIVHIWTGPSMVRR